MNTTEITFNNEISSYDELYKYAKDQFDMYEKIEGIDDWEEYDFSIDCSADQMKLKDMLQIRFIEELTEASVAMNEDDEHFWEEIGDALNFFLSAYVMLGVDFKSLPSPENYLKSNQPKVKPMYIDFSIESYKVIEAVGYLCNLLKNRPWAQQNFFVSEYDFNERLLSLWIKFWEFLNFMNINSADVFGMFWKKYQVNIHRVSTGY